MANQDKYTIEINRLLREHCATPIREKRHKVFILPNGEMYVESSTPSDSNVNRIRLAQLRRCIRKSAAARQCHPQQDPLPPPVIRRPRGQSPRWPRENAEVNIPELGSGPRSTSFASQKTISIRFEDLLRAVKMSDAFWELDACGRTRVLLKVFSTCGIKAECICVLDSLVPIGALESPVEIHEALLKAARHVRPAVLLPAFVGFVEADAFLRYTSRRKLFISRFNEGGMGKLLNRQVMLALFPLTPQNLADAGLSRTACHFKATDSWTNPKIVRPAFLEVIERCKALRSDAARNSLQ